jgi:quinolinate synthase
MKRIDLPHLLWVLDGIADGEPVNQVRVDPAIAGDAKLALDRMMAIRASQGVTKS